MDFELKTVSFGGYDKKAVETYITEMQEDYEKQITQLKETAAKLGETVDSLRKMREVNMSESKSTVDTLKSQQGCAGCTDSCRQAGPGYRGGMRKAEGRGCRRAGADDERDPHPVR